MRRLILSLDQGTTSLTISLIQTVTINSMQFEFRQIYPATGTLNTILWIYGHLIAGGY